MKHWLGAALGLLMLPVAWGPAAAQPSPAVQILLDTCKTTADGPPLTERLAACTQLITTPPGPGPLAYALTVRGVLLGRSGECDRAIADLNSAARVTPDSRDTFYSRALTRMQCRGDAAATLADLTETLRLDPEFMLAYRLRGAVYLTLQRYEEAKADFDKVLAAAPNDAVTLTDRGALELMRGNAAAALPFADAAIAADANFARAHLLRGQVLFVLRRTQDARASLDKAIALDDQDPDAFYRRAQLRLQAQNMAGSISDLDRAIALRPDSIPYKALRGQAEFLARRLEPALADFNTVLAAMPNDGNSLSGRAEVYMRTNRLAEGIRDFDAAAANTRPESRPAGYMDGKRCWARGLANVELEAAKAFCDKALAVNGQEAAILMSAGIVAFRQGRFDDAWSAFNTADKVRPYTAGYLYLRGVAAMKLGREEAGQEDIARSRTLDAAAERNYAGFGIKP